MNGLTTSGRLLLATIMTTGAIGAATAAAQEGTGGVGVEPSAGSGDISGGAGGGNAGTGGGGTETAGGESVRGVFPVRARHTYGDGLGAGRGHQGQDLLAKCGKPVVAAEPGRVRVNDFQSAAGNYVVVKGSSYDYVYLHMLRPSKLRVGSKVRAGQLLGRVGSTGSSTACHLHFEMWSRPGWYRGGSIVNPTPFLKQWDHARRGAKRGR